MEITIIICIIFIAFLYSSIGHGGASGYLGLMALIGIAPDFMRSSALLLNLFVSIIAFYAYYRAGYFRWKLFYPFALSSVPMAFIGARIEIDPKVYHVILGILLIIAAVRIVYRPTSKKPSRKPSLLWALIIGAVLGFFSGMIGIGGGIILSPLLLLLGWANIKETAAVSALFIFINSLSGLAGTWQSGIMLPSEIYFWVIAGIIGGLAGSYAGSFRFSFSWARYILSVVLLIASLKLFTI